MKKSLFTLLVMMLFGTTFAQNQTTSYYQPLIPPQLDNTYNLIAVISIDGVLQDNPNYELGAWDETYSYYVGGQVADYYPNFYPDYPCYYMAVYGYVGTETDLVTGELVATLGQSVISYRIYDHTPGQEQELPYVCDLKVNWTDGVLYGMPSTPVVLEFYTQKEMHFEGLADNDWSNAANWTADGEAIGRLPYAGEDVFIDAPCVLNEEAAVDTVTIISTASLTIEDGELTSNGIIIKDGGQFFANGETYSGIIEKEILGYGEGSGNYYFLSMPIANFDVATGFEAAGMLKGDYDLYFFTQDPSVAGEIDPEDPDTWWQGDWQNYKWYLNPESEMDATTFTDNYQINKAYLYANKDLTTLSFNGEFYVGNGQFTAQGPASGSDWGGFQLIGNPYPCNATAVGAQYIGGFYMINEQGRGNVVPVEEPVVAPATAVMVYCNNSGNPATRRRVTFTPSTDEASVRSLGNPCINIELISIDGILEDRAYVRNYESENLVKFSLRNDGSKLFIPQDGKKYAAVYKGENEVMPLCFTTTEGGIYTLSINPENMDCSYLHLIDNVTGTDVDLLRTSTYSFNSNESNYATRFKLVFAEEATNEIADSFAFISNGELMINNYGEATLQVMDITGRILSTENIQNCYSKSLNLSAGVYVVRLTNGADVKTQKIVVE